MYAQMSRVQIQPGKMDEAIGIFVDSVVPLVRQQKGFGTFYLFVDRSTDRVVVTNLWDTEADAAALLESGFYQEQVAKFSSIFANPPERVVYEVAAVA